MKLTVIGSSSAGNCYILQNDNEALMIEAGCRTDRVMSAIGYRISKVKGLLISHEHGDHSKYATKLMRAGIDCYASHGTHKAMATAEMHRARFLHPMTVQQIGPFRVLPFDVKHDAAAPLGFIIEHEECGRVLFLTDTIYSKYTFPGLHNVIVEANYCEDIINEKLLADKKFLRDRVIQNHLSIQTCKELLLANDLSQVNNVVLIHLSNSNSDEKRFKKEIESITSATVHIADSMMNIPFNKTPF